jgi:rhomboid protease GluP
MPRGSRFQDDFPVTAFLLLFNMAFFFLETIGTVKGVEDFQEDVGVLLKIQPSVTYLLGSLRLREVQDGQYWRLISATFLHGNLIHLAFNMFALMDLGRTCEPLLSRWRFLTIYTASAIGGSLASLAVRALTGDDFSSLGASGAICGLLGLLLVTYFREREDDLLQGLLRSFGVIAILSLTVPGIDHAGHLGGLLTGAAFGLTVNRYTTSRSAARWAYPGYASAALVALSLGCAAWSYFANR